MDGDDVAVFFGCAAVISPVTDTVSIDTLQRPIPSGISTASPEIVAPSMLI